MRADTQYLARLAPAGHGSLIFLTQLRRPLHKGRVGRGQPVAIQPYIILQPGAGVAPGGDAPFIYGELMLTNTCAAPICVRCQPLDGFDVVIEHISIHRHRVFHTHDELHIEPPRYPTVPV